MKLSLRSFTYLLTLFFILIFLIYYDIPKGELSRVSTSCIAIITVLNFTALSFSIIKDNEDWF